MAVVLIDDEPPALHALTAMLRALHYEVLPFNDPARALASLSAEVDLVIADVNMPGMDGFTVAERVAERLGTQPPKVLLVTGADHEARLAEYRPSKVIGLLRKPVALADLRRVTQLCECAQERCPGMLLPLCPQNRLEHRTADGVRQVYRWVLDLSYQDDQGRHWTFHAIVCEETVCEETVDEQTTTFAWITDLHVSKNTVVEVATKGGRHRWHVENQGFNRQKNSGLNLEHAYCTNADLIKAYYYLMQIAHMILQIFEAGSLLRRLAAECGQTPWQLFGGLDNLARRLQESFRYRILSDEAFNPNPNERIRYSFDSS